MPPPLQKTSCCCPAPSPKVRRLSKATGLIPSSMQPCQALLRGQYMGESANYLCGILGLVTGREAGCFRRSGFLTPHILEAINMSSCYPNYFRVGGSIGGGDSRATDMPWVGCQKLEYNFYHLHPICV